MTDAQTKIQIRSTFVRPYDQTMLTTAIRGSTNDSNAIESDSIKFTLPNLHAMRKSDSTVPEADTKDSGSAQYDEAFARSMVGLATKTTDFQTVANDGHGQSTADAPASAVPVDQENSELSQETPISASDQANKGSAANDFIDYMNQTDAEKLRQQLTGVSKEEYEKMSPEEKLAIDQKVQQLLKQKQQIAETELKAKIAISKSSDASLT